MVKRTNQNIASEITKLSDQESAAVLNYISEILSSRSRKNKEIYHQDDLIGSLQDAYENKRARQVFEWERTRRQTFYNAA